MHPITLHLPVKDHGNECGLQGRTKPLPRVKQTSVQKRILWVFPFSSFLEALWGCFFSLLFPSQTFCKGSHILLAGCPWREAVDTQSLLMPAS